MVVLISHNIILELYPNNKMYTYIKLWAQTSQETKVDTIEMLIIMEPVILHQEIRAQ